MFRTQLSFAKETAPVVKITDPLLLPFTGPYGGVPPFDKAKPALFKPAVWNNETSGAWHPTFDGLIVSDSFLLKSNTREILLRRRS